VEVADLPIHKKQYKEVSFANDVLTDLKEWRSSFILYKYALDEINTKLRILNEDFQHAHAHNPIEHIKSRVKEPESIIKKLQRKGLEITPEAAREHIHDIAGVRITCSFLSDIYHIHQMLQEQDDIRVLKVKDYIQHPKPNGYKSLHLIVEIPVFLPSRTERVKVEVQIRTVAMDFWASVEHKIYYKYDQAVPSHLKQELKETAELVHYLDHKMVNLKKDVEQLSHLTKEGVS
jgi:putative GTP pyrophosphokinase